VNLASLAIMAVEPLSGLQRALYHHSVCTTTDDDEGAEALEHAVALSLPLDEVTFFDGGRVIFPLLRNPLKDEAAAIVGMFVLRPTHTPWTG